MLSKLLVGLVMVTIIFTSCNTSNKVVSSGFIQKRKYTKGYHIDLFAKALKHSKPASENTKQLAKQKADIHQEGVLIKESNNHPDITNNVIQQKINNDLIASIDNGIIVVNNSNNYFVENDSIKVVKSSDNSTPVNNPKKDALNLFILLILIIGVHYFIPSSAIALMSGIAFWVVLIFFIHALSVMGKHHDNSIPSNHSQLSNDSSPDYVNPNFNKSSKTSNDERSVSGFALASFLIGLLGIFAVAIVLLLALFAAFGGTSFSFIPYGIFFFCLSVLGLVFAILGINQISDSDSKFWGLAFSILGILFNVLVLILAVAFISSR